MENRTQQPSLGVDFNHDWSNLTVCFIVYKSLRTFQISNVLHCNFLMERERPFSGSWVYGVSVDREKFIIIICLQNMQSFCSTNKKLARLQPLTPNQPNTKQAQPMSRWVETRLFLSKDQNRLLFNECFLKMNESWLVSNDTIMLTLLIHH